jgi:predicted restriction endonuclease
MLAYRLYCELPFGQMDHRNRRVIELAEKLQRSPSSIAMKLGNFAHLDPAMQARGIRGMANVSAQDREVARAFQSDWDNAILDTASAWSDFDASGVGEIELLTPEPVGPSEAVATAKVRLTQRFFRRAVLSAYDSTCCICKVRPSYLLVASHIMPWSSSPEHRTNPRNGLTLCVLHDKAFDVGQLTIRPTYVVDVSDELIQLSDVPVGRAAFRDIDGSTMHMPSRFLPDQEFLKYHNDHVFHR